MMRQHPRVRNLISSLCRRYFRRHGGDWDEIESAANYAYVKAVKRWEPGRGKLTTWVQTQVQFHLLQLNRDRGKRSRERTILDRRMRRTNGDDPETYADAVPAREGFNLRGFLRELSRDARMVVRKAISGLLDRTKPNRYREALALHLVDLGWDEQRILETFNEIRGAIT